MEWKKDNVPFKAGDINVNDTEGEDETAAPDDAYPPWQTPSPGDLGKKIFLKPDLPLKTIGIGVVVAIAVIILLVLATGSDDDQRQTDISRLESRIQLLENQLADMGKALADNSASKNLSAELAARLDRLETSTHTRMGQITDQVSALKNQIHTPKTAPPAKSKTSKKTVKTAGKAPSHTVKSGDTLYDIAHRYGVTVNQIKQWNQLPSSGRIYPGQKLKVVP